jgi:hypothetical protein
MKPLLWVGFGLLSLMALRSCGAELRLRVQIAKLQALVAHQQRELSELAETVKSLADQVRALSPP